MYHQNLLCARLQYNWGVKCLPITWPSMNWLVSTSRRSRWPCLSSVRTLKLWDRADIPGVKCRLKLLQWGSHDCHMANGDVAKRWITTRQSLMDRERIRVPFSAHKTRYLLQTWTKEIVNTTDFAHKGRLLVSIYYAHVHLRLSNVFE